MSKTLWDEAARRTLLERARRLSPESRPQWGSFTVDRMLAHVVDGFRMATGELAVRPKKVRLPIGRWPLNVLFIHLVGMPKHAPTARELIARPPAPLAEELRALDAQMALLASMHERTDWPAHPVFGKLSRRAWGVLGYKHLDHHLRQFGV